MHGLRSTVPTLALLFVASLQVPAHATDVLVQGGPGGQYARLLCPSGFFLHGVEVTLSAWVTSIKGKCLKYDPTTQRFGGAPQFTNLHGVPAGGQQALQCKDDQYVAGIQIGFTRDGDDPRYLDYIQINCVDLTDTTFPPAVFSRCASTGDGCWYPNHPDGDYPNLVFQQQCPAGEAASGLHGLFSNNIHKLAPVCTQKPNLTTTPAPTSVSVPTNEWLDEHNKHKKNHCTEPLYTWSVELENAAKAWADGCHLKNGVPCHETDTAECPGARGSPYGENIAASGPVRDVGQAAHTPKEAVHWWYSEISNYNYNAPELKLANPGMNGHFTQVVWKASRLLGCAQAACRIQGVMQTLSVCKYSPPGNFYTYQVGQSKADALKAALIENVLPPNCMK